MFTYFLSSVDPAVKQNLERSLSEAQELVKTCQEKIDLLVAEEHAKRKEYGKLKAQNVCFSSSESVLYSILSL